MTVQPFSLDLDIDEGTLAMLIQRFPPLEPGARQKRPEIKVPVELTQCIRDVLKWCASGVDPSSFECKLPKISPNTNATEELMPGKSGMGSSKSMHQDVAMDVMFSRAYAERIASNGYVPDPQDVLDAYIAVLYLDGCGSMKFDLSSGEHIDILIKPGRLVVWPNRECKHGFVDTSEDGGVRHLLGPMAMSAETEWRSVAHTFSWMAGMDEPAQKVRQGTRRAKEVFVITVDRSPQPGLLVFRNVAGDELCTLDFTDGDIVEEIQSRLYGACQLDTDTCRISLRLPSGALLRPDEDMASALPVAELRVAEATANNPATQTSQFTVGDTVYVVGADRFGKIILADPSDPSLTYKIKFNDGVAPDVDWFASDAVSSEAASSSSTKLSL